MTHPTVDAAALRDLLASDRPPALLDVRWRLAGPSGPDEYRRGHLPGARFVDLETELAAPPGRRGRHPLPDPEVFGSAMRRCGVRGDRPVVVYDDAGGTSAARAWWLLRRHGHPEVALLDGGLAAWTAAGGVLEQGDVTGPEGDFVPVETPTVAPMVDAAGAAALAREGVLLDARAGERYRGEVEPIDPVAGHIPGAVSAPTTENVDPAGRLLPPQALRARFAALGVRGSTPVGVYCGSGVTAAHEVLALAVAGVEAALYPGSWSEWVADPSRPVATGPGPG